MSDQSRQDIRALLRTDFHSLMVRCFAELFGAAAYQGNWHIEVVASKLQAAQEGKVKRLIINIPPRHLKSLMASIALPAWWLGRDPTAAIINTTYGQDLSDKFARDSRAVMTSRWYQDAFKTRLTSSRSPLQELTTTRGGYRLATSVGGVLTGRGADVIIIDDPLKPIDAMSETRRKSVNDWYDGTLYSRLNDKKNGTIIIVMQRLHEDDLVGHVLRQEGWEVVSLPAIAEVDEEYLIDTPVGRKRYVRRAGEALHPERESLETLANIRETMGTYNFAGQYMQSPAPAGGGLVKEAWFRWYDDSDRPKSFYYVIQSWDTASKPTELADYSVCTTWGIYEKRFYLLNVFRQKLSYPELKRAFNEQRRLFRPAMILVEDKASGTQLIQEAHIANDWLVRGVTPENDKIMRLNAQTAAIENGLVYLPKYAHWVPDFLHEICMFPNGRHDDQVDALSQFLCWWQTNPYQLPMVFSPPFVHSVPRNFPP